MLLNIFLLSALSLCVATSALYLSSLLLARGETTNKLKLKPDDGETAFLFDDELLVDATPEARAILDSTPPVGTDWSRLLSAFISQFPDLQTKIVTLADEGNLTFESRNGQAILICEWRRGLARITLNSDGVDENASLFDRHVVQAMEQELITLRATSDNGPLLVWREHLDGTVTWANTAYLALADSFDPTDEIPSWPPRRLFGTADDAPVLDGDPDAAPLPAPHPLADANDVDTTSHSTRLNLAHPDGRVLWFDVYKTGREDGALFTAVPSNMAVDTEAALRAFSQTLKNTFSHLSIGLAVFNRERRLVMHNPALLDLTTLAAEQLDRSPTLYEFLDKLRDRRMMPEPKDYKSWRQSVAELEEQAQDGTFEELWALPSETTYRVSGRSHADGAIAFFFEDITSEVSLSRRFRSEIETGQAVLDGLDDAIAVFASNGRVVMTNTGYNSLWGLDGLASIEDVGIIEAARLWHSKCAPTAIWNDIKDVVAGEAGITEWRGVARLWDGRRLTCQISALPSGQTMARFKPDKMVTNTPRSAPQNVDPAYVKM